MATSKYPPFPSWHRSKLRSRTVPDTSSPSPTPAAAAAAGGGNHKRPLHIKQEDCSGDTHWPESRRERIRAAGRTPGPTTTAGIHKSRLYPDSPKVKVEKKARPADTSPDDDRPPAKKAKVKAESRSDSHMMLADSISKLSGICERMEDRRRKHMKELEKMRAGFRKEMEAHKKQLLEQAQAKIESLREAGNDGAIDDFVERLSCWVRYEMFCSPVNF